MMEEVNMSNIGTDESCDNLDYDSFDDQKFEPPAERWAPLGASASPGPSGNEEYNSDPTHTDQLQKLEEEQEQLNSSLLALTTHFAQVQFRLKQIITAPSDDKESLLKELEEFAFKGIPDVRGSHIQDALNLEELSDKEHEKKITEQRKKQQELIAQLKSQLQDLESFAYETGDGELPTSVQMEKHQAMIEQFKNKLDLNIEDFDQKSTEELKQAVDQAIKQIVNPAKVKEKVVEQLKTQIVDLERYISFLQGDAGDPGPIGEESCKCNCHEHKGHGHNMSDADCCIPHHKHTARLHSSQHKEESTQKQALGIMKRALTILQIFAISQFGCGGREFQKNLLKRTPKGNHWGDIRARLEVAITKVIDLHNQQQHLMPVDSDYTSDNEDTPACQANLELTQAIRKELAMALKDLLQHGLMEVGQSTALVPFGCFSNRSARTAKANTMMHAWDLIEKYYDMKKGKQYNESPARKLSMSFALDMVGGQAVTTKQTLLGAIGTIINSHEPLKRSQDSKFKAFVCLGLNEKKLVSWLRLIVRTQSLIDYYYQSWSYVSRTGGEDIWQSLDKLKELNFNLPMDLAVRQFSNIKDAF